MRRLAGAVRELVVDPQIGFVPGSDLERIPVLLLGEDLSGPTNGGRMIFFKRTGCFRKIWKDERFRRGSKLINEEFRFKAAKVDRNFVKLACANSRIRMAAHCESYEPLVVRVAGWAETYGLAPDHFPIPAILRDGAGKEFSFFR